MILDCHLRHKGEGDKQQYKSKDQASYFYFFLTKGISQGHPFCAFPKVKHDDIYTPACWGVFINARIS